MFGVSNTSWWKCNLARSKTTGPDKAEQNTPVVISRASYLVEQNLFEEGHSVNLKQGMQEREFLLCEPRLGERGAPRELKDQEYAGRLRGVIARLCD